MSLPTAPRALRPLRASAELCEFCPKMCRFACPVSEAEPREKLTPWGKVSLAALTTLAGTPPDPSAAQAFAGCTGCLRCQRYCAHENDVPTTLYAARAAAVRAQSAPSAWTQVAARFLAAGHAEDADLAGALAALHEEERVRPQADRAGAAPPGGRPLLFAGCDALAAGGAAARDALAAARGLGAPLELAPAGALCCGLKAVEAGHPELFAAQARKTLALLAPPPPPAPSRRRAEPAPVALVFLSPACARAVRGRWAAAGALLPAGSTVEHVTTYLARALEARPDLRSRKKLAGPVAWHDPCELARGLDETEAPRALLAAAVEGGAREPLRCGADTSCCGAGGLLPRTLPAVAAAVADGRRAELAACDAPVVTASPACAAHLGAGDLVALVARWLGETA